MYLSISTSISTCLDHKVQPRTPTNVQSSTGTEVLDPKSVLWGWANAMGRLR